MSETPTQRAPLPVTLTYDGSHIYIDGERARLLLGMSSGAVFIATATRRLAVSQGDFDRARHAGAALADELPVTQALKGRALWSEGIDELD